jgi:hypothetical protein
LPAGCLARLAQAYLGQADAELELNRHADAALAIAELANLLPPQSADWPRLAGTLARAVDAAASDEVLPPAKRQDLARRYGDQAIDLLRKAIRAGYKDVEALQQSITFAPLRNRPDFQQLVRDLGR